MTVFILPFGLEFYHTGDGYASIFPNKICLALGIAPANTMLKHFSNKKWISYGESL
jgi:hypothetical protein